MTPPKKECPYESALELRAAIVAAGSITRLAARLGVSRNLMYTWAERLGDDLVTGTLKVPEAELPDGTIDQDVLARLRKASYTVGELADSMDCSPRRVREAMERLQAGGYRVEASADEVVRLDRVEPAPAESISPLPKEALWHGDWIRFAVVSDTHGGSVEHQKELLDASYDQIEALGIQTVYHGGDIVEGLGIYRHQVRAIAPGAHTFEGQVDLAVRDYPQREGITTYVIGGNHDLEGEFGRMGADPVAAICNQREDLVYLGPYSAWVELPNGAFVRILHGKAGNSYAKSYRLQKLCESYQSGRKPAMLLVGHYHGRCIVRWRSIEAVMLGTYQGATELATRSGFDAPEIGFHVIEACLADDGSLVRYRPEWFATFTGRHVIAA